MPTVAELQSCDGFAVEGRGGVLGWVEETWLDASGHPGALAVRTPDGRRALLLTDAVTAVDPGTQEVLVEADTTLLELDAPRLEDDGGAVAALWRTTGAVVEPLPAALPSEAAPSWPAVAASRAATVHRERPPWQIVALFLGSLAAIVAFEIALAFLVAYLVTGHAY
jgi:hypothetical protein